MQDDKSDVKKPAKASEARESKTEDKIADLKQKKVRSFGNSAAAKEPQETKARETKPRSSKQSRQAEPAERSDKRRSKGQYNSSRSNAKSEDRKRSRRSGARRGTAQKQAARRKKRHDVERKPSVSSVQQDLESHTPQAVGAAVTVDKAAGKAASTAMQNRERPSSTTERSIASSERKDSTTGRDKPGAEPDTSSLATRQEVSVTKAKPEKKKWEERSVEEIRAEIEKIEEGIDKIIQDIAQIHL